MSLTQAEAVTRSPAMQRRLVRSELWLHARVLPLLAARWSFRDALAYAHADPAARYEGLSAELIARWVQRATRKPWLMRKRRCLRQGLLGARFMRLAGHDCELHFGIDRASLDADKLSAHCWVVLDGRSVLNTILDDMVVIHVDRGTDAVA